MRQAKSFEDSELKAGVFRLIGTRRHGVRDRAIVALSFFAGLRAHEIASLSVGTVLGTEGRALPEIALLASQTKGNRGRKVFLSDRLRKELDRYVKTLGSELPPEQPLFLTQKGNAFTANAMCHLFRDIYREAGIAGASSHSGRRTFITNLAGKGVGVRVLAALAGHASISTTQRYIDVNDLQLRAAVELA